MHCYLRFFFSYGVSDTPLWPNDVDSPYGYPCDLQRLPISLATRTELVRLCECYQASLDWDNPGGPSPWPEEQWELFEQQADAALAALQHELGDGWVVMDRRSRHR
ncbi:hypothetical protein E1283_04660 [Streptomyces hainanensis]|uniref:Uncharacterized protein n=1 Tax=Streptomyces hainanensis TaxID=402648 RepID=A0A4R4TL12_9ACTN|nr:hypothetical protein E1283_04660 [Streptomyces hainanensis]